MPATASPTKDLALTVGVLWGVIWVKTVYVKSVPLIHGTVTVI